AGVTRVITIGTHRADHHKALSLAAAHAPVYAALGVHPHHAAETEEGYEAQLEHSLCQHPKVLALGECGLDYHYDFCPKPRQHDVFTRQLKLARRLKLPVILHVREAHDDALAIARDFVAASPEGPGIRFLV